MAAPTLQAEGSQNQVTTGSLTLTLPAHQTNDILVAVVLFWLPNTAGSAATIPDLSGWTKAASVMFPATPDGEVAFFWRRATSGSETNPTFTRGASWDTGTDGIYAGRAFVVRGCNTTGDPWDELDPTGALTAANGSCDAVTVSGSERTVIQFLGKTDDFVTEPTISGWTAGTQTESTTGTDSSFGTFRKENVSSSTAADASTVEAPAAGAYVFFGASFKPLDPTGTVAVTQADQTSSASGTVSDPSFIVTARPGSNATAGTSHTVTFPDGSNVSGRLVVIGFSCDGGTVSWPAGWSELTDQTSTGVTLSTAYRIIDGTEGFDGTDDTITVTTSATTQSNFHPRLIQGAHASTAPEAASAAPGTPDPPNLDPAGWDVEESLWLAFSASRFSGTYTAAPANYTNLLSTDVGTDVAPLGSAFRILSAGSENPGTFTENGGNESFITATIAIRPASAGGVTGTVAVTQADQTSSATGVLGYSGTTSVTQGDQTSSASGQLGYSGTVAVAQADQTSAASGQLGSTGTLTVTQADQTSTASGTVGGIGEVTGTLAETQDAQTSTATGQLGSSGVLAASQTNQTATAVGWITITGTVTEAQDPQTVVAAGQLGSTGTVAVTQANQVATAAGWIEITGLIARTQDPQTCAATGFVGVIPTPAGVPLSVPAGSHAVEAPRSVGVTVPKGTHVVEATR